MQTNTKIIGIDCAVLEQNIGLAYIEFGNPPTLYSLAPGKSGEVISQIVEWCSESEAVLLALDAPLGWPESMGKQLSDHFAGEGIAVQRNILFNRDTDRFIREHYGKKPLEVGASLIARTAHASLELLQSLRKALDSDIPLAWNSTIEYGISAIEVYPAATVIAHGFGNTNYHSVKNQPVKDSIVNYLTNRFVFQCESGILEDNPHVLDAALCALAGYDFLQGDCHDPHDMELAEKERWIWVHKV